MKKNSGTTVHKREPLARQKLGTIPPRNNGTGPVVLLLFLLTTIMLWLLTTNNIETGTDSYPPGHDFTKEVY